VKRILICDDEHYVLEGLRYLLRGPGRQIEIARNGREGLEQIIANPPDLLITDVMMPEMSGLELVAAIREREDTADLAVIILTAKGQAQDATRAQESWGALVIAKPFDPTTVREMVRQALENGSCLSN